MELLDILVSNLKGSESGGETLHEHLELEAGLGASESVARAANDYRVVNVTVEPQRPKTV